MKNINIIPSIIITRILKDNNFEGLCSLPLKTKFIQFGKGINGLYVYNNYGINYNNQIDVKKRYNNIQNEDIIIGIDSLELNSEGYIYYKPINYHIPIDTYILLEKRKLSNTSVKIYRKKKGNTHKLLDINVLSRPIYTMTYLPYSLSKKEYIIGSLIFSELTEEFIEEHFYNKIKLGGNCMDNYGKNNYRNLDKKVIIVKDINREFITKKEEKKLSIIDFPLVKLDDDIHGIPILYRIGKKNISSIDDIINIVEKNGKSKMTLHFKISNDYQCKLSYKNNELL